MTLWHILPLVLDTYRRWQAKAPFECFAQRLATKTQPGKQSTNSNIFSAWSLERGKVQHQVTKYKSMAQYGFLAFQKDHSIIQDWFPTEASCAACSFPRTFQFRGERLPMVQQHATTSNTMSEYAMETSILTWTTILTTSNDFAFATRWPDQAELPPAREIVCLHVIPCLCPESCSRFVSCHTQVLTIVTCKTTEWSPRAAPKTHKPQIMNDSESS